jgi:hypothetical protein
MSTTASDLYERGQGGTLAARLREPRRFLQVIASLRQVGKTTLVGQVLDRLDIPSVLVSADEPTLGDISWLARSGGSARGSPQQQQGRRERYWYWTKCRRS